MCVCKIFLFSAILLLIAIHRVEPKKNITGCPTHKFNCGNQKCISGSLWCNGFDNCGNGADEFNCTVCLSGSLSCSTDSSSNSQQCVPPNARCNGQRECANGLDEEGCPAQGDSPASNSTANDTISSTTYSNAAPKLGASKYDQIPWLIIGAVISARAPAGKSSNLV